MKSLNFVLDLTNGVVSVLTFFFLLYLTHYLITEHRRRRLSWRKALKALPMGMTLALALYIEKTGALITRATVWVWRRVGVGGGGGPTNAIQTEFMVLGAVFLAIGLLALLRVLSKPRYGDKLWIIAFVVAVIYTGVAVFSPIRLP